MKLNRLVLVFVLTMLSTYGWAHPGHDEPAPPLDQAQATQVAVGQLAQLIEDGKVDSAWGKIDSSSAELKRVEGRQNWVVTFVDNQSKKVLTVMLTNTGTYLSVTSSDV